MHKKKRSIDNSMAMSVRKKSFLHRSISFHIPMEMLDSTTNPTNCYMDLPQKKFNVTYLDVDVSQNPETLDALVDLKGKHWSVYILGHLYNFNYKPEQIRNLQKALIKAFTREFKNSNQEKSYNATVSFPQDMDPTENDQPAMKIQVVQCIEDWDKLLYEGYLVSWCNPVNCQGIILPLLLSRGSAKSQVLVNKVLTDSFDVHVKKFLLTQDEFVNLATYALIMLDYNDTYTASFVYEVLSQQIKFDLSTRDLLSLWQKNHTEDTIEVDIEEVLHFNSALDKYLQSSFGISLDSALFSKLAVKGCFKLSRKSQMNFHSTKIIHVVLKYLTYLSVQRQKLKALGLINVLDATN